ncbi:MAG: leucyl/phenylalanyl-tRNA--protein transferase [Proteobacteria bacterium]|nr:leucyl/phenylalanyl-tRNA--protein transferase [Pseudomonadota bacterium]
MTSIAVLNPQQVGFPDPAAALDSPNGLLAAGGDLTANWLMTAYSQGIFPWYNDDDEPILWWSPDPRAVIRPTDMRVTRSLTKRIRNGDFTVSADTVFDQVVKGCSQSRQASGTWITPRMCQAYTDLHHLGYAHSIEVWHKEQLVGGLYGVSLGRMFFGESMFTVARDASKVAFYWLCELLKSWKFDLLDCQVMNDHLLSLGVGEMPRSLFLQIVSANRVHPHRLGPWSMEQCS